MLRDTIALYTELSGNDGENTPIAIIGAYLDGYERGKADRPHGEWILTDIERDRVWHGHCSECGKDPQDYIGGTEDWWLLRNNLPKFCPNCGAEMRGDRQ